LKFQRLGNADFVVEGERSDAVSDCCAASARRASQSMASRGRAVVGALRGAMSWYGVRAKRC